MIKEHLVQVRRRIDDACHRSGREAKEIELVFVSKLIGADKIQEAHALGIRDFGENRVQEFQSKQGQLPRDIRWHFIGSLQTNKVKHVVGNVHLLHSCDRIDLARALQKEAEKLNVTVPLLIQVNTSEETSKHGFSVREVEKSIHAIVGMGRLNIKGLMTMAPFTEDDKLIRRSFQSLRELKEKLTLKFSECDWRYLSMGMSGDFEIAIEEGANLLRLGTAVFGARPARA
jgi:PLP dependent protein